MKVFLQEHFSTKRVEHKTECSCGNLRGSGIVGVQGDDRITRQATALSARISVRVFLQEHFFRLGICGCSLGEQGSGTRTMRLEMFLQEHSRSTFAPFVVKREKCSCRNTVENSPAICSKFKQIAGCSHFQRLTQT
jgi:hypothetical protein